MGMVQRYQRVAFMNTGTSENPTFTRMTGFTSMSNSKNAKEYTRQYVDEPGERSDVVGYAPSTDYAFDRDSENAVHKKIAAIHDGELVGNDTHVEILVVDLFDTSSGSTENCVARKREYAVVPSTDGDSVDALTYSGSFKAVGKFEEGTATVSADGQTATYTKKS